MISYFFKTYGCQANVADSQGLAMYLNEMGCIEALSEKEADIIIVNTCAVREKAEQKLWSYLGLLADIKKIKPHIKIGVIGCVASYKKKEIYQRFDLVNFVYGAREEIPILQTYLTDLVIQLETTKQLFVSPHINVINTKQNPTKKFTEQDRDIKDIVTKRGLIKKPIFSTLTSFSRTIDTKKATSVHTKEAVRSFVNIMTGCNKYCSYCIVPFTRGRETNYPMSEIIERVSLDVAHGAKEVTLIGQNVNSYIDPDSGALFPELLRNIAKISGNFWIRYISPHPQDMTIDLFEVMAEFRPKIAAALHFPLQSGSDTILASMNRNYTTSTYLEKINWIRRILPDATISTDIIVGFPGETEDDFSKTMDLVRSVQYDLIYSFIYSPRKYTKAWKMEDSCPAEIKSTRLTLLQNEQISIALLKNMYNIGKSLLCLVEKPVEHGKLLARTEGNIRVMFDGSDELVNEFVIIQIESTSPTYMNGIFVEKIEKIV